MAIALMVGEGLRSWGEARPLAFVIDDTIAGTLLIVSAWLMKQDTTRRRAFFASAWGVNSGMLYGSFFEKLIEPDTSDAGNFSFEFLTLAIGGAFLVSCIGTFLAIMIPRGRVRYP